MPASKTIEHVSALLLGAIPLYMAAAAALPEPRSPSAP